MLKKTVYLACFLAIVGIICSGLVASVYALTQPIIEGREQDEKETTIRNVFPTMTWFEESQVASKYETIQVIYNVYNQEHTCIGVVYELVTKGYGGDIQLLVAYDGKTKELINLRYMGTFSETPGFGSQVKEEKFLSQILNQSVEQMEIETLSGATITSLAVKKAIEEANHHFMSQN